MAVALLARLPLQTRDPRILIAGAVLAWAQASDQGALIMTRARGHIPAVEVSRRRLRLRAEAADEALQGQDAGDAVRDAILLDAILRRPRLLRRAP